MCPCNHLTSVHGKEIKSTELIANFTFSQKRKKKNNKKTQQANNETTVYKLNLLSF